jgi:hypothetical protein
MDPAACTWANHGEIEINMSLVDKILSWHTNQCCNQKHFLFSGGVSEHSKKCSEYHGDADRRRQLCTSDFFTEVVENYQGICDAQVNHLAQIIAHMHSQSVLDRQNTLAFYFRYADRMCEIASHLGPQASPELKQSVDECQWSHNAQEHFYHVLTLWDDLVRFTGQQQPPIKQASILTNN